MKKLLLCLLSCLLLAGCTQVYDGPVEKEKVLIHKDVAFTPFAQSETMHSHEEYAYDVYGNLALIRSYQAGELTWEQRNTYDDRGNLVKSVSIDHTGWIPYTESRVKNTYDDQGRILSHTKRNFWFREVYHYDQTIDDETHTYTTVYRSDGVESVSWFREELDDRGNVLKSIYDDGDENRNFYDEAGNRVRRESWKEGVLQKVISYTYDDRGRVLERISTDGAGNVTSELHYEYTDYPDGGYRMLQRENALNSRMEEYTADGRLLTVEDRGEQDRVIRSEHYIYDYIEVPAEKEE